MEEVPVVLQSPQALLMVTLGQCQEAVEVVEELLKTVVQELAE